MVRLVYGMGATKAGSSWLYRLLQFHPECHLRAPKELHFFDAIEFNLSASRVRRIEERIGVLQGRLEARPRVRKVIKDLRDWLQVARSNDQDAYLRFLTEGRGAKTLVADVTPNYSRVSEETLSRMTRVLPDTRFVFLMRDPVARLWSHIRMLARKARVPGDDATQLAARTMEQVLAEPGSAVVSRGFYDQTLRRLKAVVPASQVHVDFFEETVLTGEIGRLCAFLGIAPRLPSEREYHKGMKVAISADQHRRLLAILAPQYDFVRREFGRLPAAWEASLARA
jgi:hypothetical protein